MSQDSIQRPDIGVNIGENGKTGSHVSGDEL
jgi:hypothetical protein